MAVRTLSFKREGGNGDELGDSKDCKSFRCYRAHDKSNVYALYDLHPNVARVR